MQVRRQFELLQENVEGWRVLDAAQSIEDLQKQVGVPVLRFD